MTVRLGLAAALATALAAGASADKARVDWLAKHALPIRTIDPDDDDFADLAPLQRILRRVRVVQLGEQSHGDGATFFAKTRLIRFLHERMGFDVLAWESGFTECEAMNRAFASNIPVMQAGQRGVFRIWSDGGLLRPLFEYIRSTSETSRPLRQTGFDVQGVYAGLPEDFYAFFNSVDKEMVSKADREAIRDLLVALRTGEKPSGEDRRRRRDALGRALEAIRERAPASRDRLFYGRVLENLLVLEQMRAEGMAKGGPIPSARDRQMGENIVWLAEQWYPGRKLIVWAASLHVAHNPPAVDPQTEEFSYQGYTNMGSVVREKLRRDVYTIGFTAYGGHAGSPQMTPWMLQPPAEGSLESLLHAAGRPYAMVDFRGLGRRHWLRRKLVARPFGYTEMRADWSGQFDAMFYTETMFPNTFDGAVPEGVRTRRR